MKEFTVDFDPDRSFYLPNGITRVGYMVIDPETATVMLDANNNNRKVSPQTTDQYARALDRGDWPFTGDALRFGPNGVVLDGQHRLLAIESTEKSMECLVVSGLPKSVQRYIDSGRKRSAADQLHMDGVANATSMGAAARLMLSWEHWRGHSGKTLAVAPGNAEVSEYVLDHIGPLEEALKYSAPVRRETGASLPALMSAYMRAVQVTEDPILVTNFYVRLATGTDLKLGQPVHTLRGYLIRSKVANRLLDLYSVVRAWNAE